jgi:hypothetical protein
VVSATRLNCVSKYCSVTHVPVVEPLDRGGATPEHSPARGNDCLDPVVPDVGEELWAQPQLPEEGGRFPLIPPFERKTESSDTGLATLGNASIMLMY